MEAARSASAADLDVVLALHATASAELWPTRGGALHLLRDSRPVDDASALAAVLDDPVQHLVVGTIDATIVGYGLVRIEDLRDGTTLGVIDDLFVLPGARAVGVGEAMMDQLLTFCERHGCIGVDAIALPGNRDTKNFFETFGLVARAIVVHRSLPRREDP